MKEFKVGDRVKLREHPAGNRYNTETGVIVSIYGGMNIIFEVEFTGSVMVPAYESNLLPA